MQSSRRKITRSRCIEAGEETGEAALPDVAACDSAMGTRSPRMMCRSSLTVVRLRWRPLEESLRYPAVEHGAEVMPQHTLQGGRLLGGVGEERQQMIQQAAEEANVA